jgi:hypothetical protein
VSQHLTASWLEPALFERPRELQMRLLFFAQPICDLMC